MWSMLHHPLLPFPLTLGKQSQVADQAVSSAVSTAGEAAGLGVVAKQEVVIAE